MVKDYSSVGQRTWWVWLLYSSWW